MPPKRRGKKRTPTPEQSEPKVQECPTHTERHWSSPRPLKGDTKKTNEQRYLSRLGTLKPEAITAMETFRHALREFVASADNVQTLAYKIGTTECQLRSPLGGLSVALAADDVWTALHPSTDKWERLQQENVITVLHAIMANIREFACFKDVNCTHFCRAVIYLTYSHPLRTVARHARSPVWTETDTEGLVEEDRTLRFKLQWVKEKLDALATVLPQEDHRDLLKALASELC